MKDEYIDNLITEEFNRTTERLVISAQLRSKIKAETIGIPRTLSNILRDFLNRKIEISLIPLVVAVAIVVVIILPTFKVLSTFPRYGKIVVSSQYKTIVLGNATIIIDKDWKGDDLHANY